MKKFVAYALILFATSSLAAITPSTELTYLLNNFNSLQANFEQFSTNSKGKSLGEKTIGKMALKRPGKFSWETASPNKQLIIINGNQSSLYDADLEQVVNKKINSTEPNNPATLLSSSTSSLTKSFVITKVNSPNKNPLFQLTPKNKENTYQWIKIGFIDKKLKFMQIANNLGQTTTINFSNIIFNPSLSTKTFVFTPPPNTEVFNQSK